jgi:hypothetical protein
MVVALLQRGEVNLTRWLPYVPCRGVQAPSKQRRLSRWLHNRRPNVRRLRRVPGDALPSRPSLAVGGKGGRLSRPGLHAHRGHECDDG